MHDWHAYQLLAIRVWYAYQMCMVPLHICAKIYASGTVCTCKNFAIEYAQVYICTCKISLQPLFVCGWMIHTRHTLYNTTNWYIRIFCHESISDFLPYHDRELVLQMRQDCNANYPRNFHFPTRFRHVKTTQNTTNIIIESAEWEKIVYTFNILKKLATMQ